jgi:DNA-binding response OmpR family regulator
MAHSSNDNVHVLYVDSNARSADLFRGLTPTDGAITADVLSNVKSACEKLEGTAVYDFIIVALDAASAEGINLLQLISYDASLCGAAVIFLTERGAHVSQATADVLRSDTFMVKPAGPLELETFLGFLTASAAGPSAAQPGIAPVGAGHWNEPIELMAA